MPKLKPGTIVPTVEEDRAITAAARADTDAVPLTDTQWAKARLNARVGRPRTDDPRTLVSIRLPESTLAKWRASGPGWQTRMADLLTKAV